jgi:hypothetical protein
VPLKQPFPNAGTDRRPDELKRNLHTEAESVVAHDRAIETDRVADEDRENTSVALSSLTETSRGLRQLVNILALAVLALSIMVILLGTMLALSLG